MSARAAHPWFNNAVVEGVQLLYSLSLPGCPAGEVLPLTTSGWIEVLWRRGAWDEPLDGRRVRQAFISLAGSCDRWPAPRQLLDHLPPRPEVLALTAAPPPITVEQRARLADLKRRLVDRMLSTPQARAVRPDTPTGGGCPQEGGAGMVSATAQTGTDESGRELQNQGSTS